MDEHLKQRLVGALVLLSAAVIFLPLIFDGRDDQQSYTDIQIPEEPVVTLDVSEPVLDTTHFESVKETVQEQRDAIAPSEDDLNASASAIDALPEPEPMPKSEEQAAREDFASIKAAADSSKERSGSDRLADNYTIQLAAFSSMENAEKLHKRLIEKNYNAYIQKGKGAGKTLYRVFVGPQLRKNRADIIAQALYKEFKLKGMVVRYAP